MRPLWLWLSAFVLVSCIGLNLGLSRLDRSLTSFDYARVWLDPGREPGFDSWNPMRQALEHLREQPDDLLYRELFFERKVKFQYAPTSLLFFEALEHSPFGDFTTDVALNDLSWLAVLVNIVLVGWIFLRSSHPDGSPAGWHRALLSFWAVALAAAATLTFYPILRSYQLGQLQTWVNALSAAMILAWVVGRRDLAGVLSGIVCLMKPPLLLLLFWGALRRDWRFTGWLGGTLALGGLLSVGLYGLANHLDYVSVLGTIGRVGESFHANQSVNGLLHRLLGNGNNVLWTPNAFPPFHPVVYAGTLASSLVLVAMALAWRRHDSPSSLPDFLIALLTFTLASPIAWEHHYGVILPMLAAIVPLCARLRPRLLWGVGLSFVLCGTLVTATRDLAFTPWSLLQSHVFFGGALLLWCLYRVRLGL